MNTKNGAEKRLLRALGTTLSWAFTSLLFVIFYGAVLNTSHQISVDLSNYDYIMVGTVTLGLTWIWLTDDMILKVAAAWKAEGRLLEVLGAIFPWTFTTLLFVIFYTAALNPAHEVVLDINAYGEMGIEMILFGLIWAALTVNMMLAWMPKRQKGEVATI